MDRTANTALGRWLYRVLFLAPFALGIWLLIAWLVFKTTFAGFVGLIFTGPIAFIQVLILALVIWLRPGVRQFRSVDGASAAWLVGTALLWGAGAVLESPWGPLLQVAGFLVGAIGIGWVARRGHAENLTAMNAMFDSAGMPRPDGSSAPNVITVDERAVWEEREASAASASTEPVVEGEVVDDERDEPEGEMWSEAPRNPS